MPAPTISVAIGTCNGAPFLREQLESILRQSKPANEIVISDDASTDDTVSIARDTIMRWPGVSPTLTILQNDSRLGVVKNFEQATAACTGDLIALCDQDDVWVDDKLERFVQVFSTRPELLLAHSDATRVAEDRSPLPHSLLESLEMTRRERNELVSGRSFSTFVRRNLVTGATVVFRRSLLAAARPFPDAWVHDEWLAIIAAACGVTHLLDEPLIEYRQHERNQIGARKPGVMDKIRKLRETRDERNSHLVERASILVQRLESLGEEIAPARLEFARGKLAFDRRREGYPRMRALRLPAILTSFVARRYSRFARGAIDAARDLAQPAARRATG